MRRALALAVEQGLGREAAVIHNNLAIAIWLCEGPEAALAACREGLDFCERRGIAEWELGIAAMSLTFLAATGQPEQALAEAEPLEAKFQATGSVDVVETRSAQFRLLAQCGEHGPNTVPVAEGLVAGARDSAEPQMISMAFAAAAELLLAQGRPEEAQALLAELEQVPTIRAAGYYAALGPEFVRTALALEAPGLASLLVEGVELRTPLFERAVRTCRAQVAEADGEQAEAAELYAEAARWRELGNVPERAYALLGQGRCLATLGSQRRRSRCARRTSYSRRWVTSPRSRKPRRCSARARPLLYRDDPCAMALATDNELGLESVLSVLVAAVVSSPSETGR
jgi:hypothetical protein